MEEPGDDNFFVISSLTSIFFLCTCMKVVITVWFR